MTELEQQAAAWIAPYWNAQHLLNTREWVVALDPNASEALRIAALVHDCERMFPGGPAVDPSLPADDAAYLREHSERSARLAEEWLRETGADGELVAAVEELVRLHEVGGTPEADLLQAADSVSFLDVNGWVVVRWVDEGRATPAQARAKLDYMLERISLERASSVARPLYERAVADLQAAVP